MFRKAFLAAGLFAACALAPIADAQILLGAGHPTSGGGGGGIGTPVNLGYLVTTGAISAADFVLPTTADSPAGAAIICPVGWEVGAADRFLVSATDTAGNSYAVETFKTSTYNSNVQAFYKLNAAALPTGGTITAVINTGGSIGYRSLACYSVTGLVTVSGRDFYGSDTGTGTTPTVTTGTLSTNKQIIFAFTQPFVGTNYTESAGFTTLDTLTAVNNRFDTAYKIVASTASVTYQPTIPAGEYVAAAISFKGQ